MPVALDDSNTNVSALGMSGKIIERTNDVLFMPGPCPLLLGSTLHLLTFVGLALSVLKADQCQNDADRSRDSSSANASNHYVGYTGQANCHQEARYHGESRPSQPEHDRATLPCHGRATIPIACSRSA